LDHLKEAPQPDISGAAPVDRIAANVAAYIEPITRFSRADISQDAPDHPIAAPTALTVSQSVHFGIGRYAGPRALPDHITLLADRNGLEAALNKELIFAESGCDDALASWIVQEPAAYRRIMPHEAAFRRPPIPFGMQYTCVDCAGRCQVTCGGCGGARRVTCHGCHGAGQVSCGKCGGSGSRSCGGCGGSGSVASYNSNTPGARTTCGGCGGAGRTRCGCGNGSVSCGTCSGAGRITCGTCGGAGCVDCVGCAASGMQHEWGIVNATVNVQEELSFVEVAPALQTVISERIATIDLPDYGQYLGAGHKARDQAVDSRYALRIDASFATLHAAAQQFPLYGLGPDARVLDFGNIAGKLLEDDLATLESRGPKGTFWRLRQPVELLDAMKQFTESELNLLIAEQLNTREDGSKESAAAVEARFHSMVDSGYVARADTALRAGFRGLYGNSFLLPALGLLLAVSVFEILIYAYGPNDLRLLGAMMRALLAGAVGWVALELVLLYRLVNHFPKPQRKRLRKQFRAGTKMGLWRIGMAVTLVLSTYWTAKLLNNVPIARYLRYGPPVEVPWDGKGPTLPRIPN
jgi:hypothetical protein